MADNQLAVAQQEIDRVQVVAGGLDEVTRLYKQVLKEGEDYGVPKGMNIKKPFIYLAGIEKVMRLHRLRADYSLYHAERDRGGNGKDPWYYFEVKCELYDQNDIKVSEGNAISHTEERAYHPSGYSKQTHADLVWAGINRCRKMGDIRALRSAIKGYGMLSHIFNIDEDTFDAGQANAALDPMASQIEGPEHVQWLVGSTNRSASEIANILGITKWGDWTGTLLEAHNTVMLSAGSNIEEGVVVESEPNELADPANVEALRDKVGGNMPDDLLMSFLGTESFADFEGTVDDAHALITEAIGEAEQEEEPVGKKKATRKKTADLDAAPA